MDLPDYLGSKFHSERLANIIRAHYRKRGIEPHVWVEREGKTYVIRSNLQFSFPPPRPA
jgi:hypothetical protein